MKVYTVECRTGCTCCSYENHTRGIYSSYEAAARRVKDFHARPLLASQFAATGRYSICPREAEKLPDGRLIIDGERVVEEQKIFDVTEDGKLMKNGEVIHADDLDHLGDADWPR